ncbi:P-loop containing nucleoside triphosphate hydrolase protein [Thozetella sp. PMI_491]|nr:P-loop containing nucleoside triphosphate hydrolase protein [Thozetella sp. PMI_491]
MEPSPEPSLEADETDSIPRSATPNLLERIAHLQCLVNFIHDNLKGLIEMRAQITNGTLKSIAFDDLWHLFRPGDLVVTSEHGRERLNRVFFVTGGLIQRKRKRMNDERRPQYHGLGTWTSFRIYTYQMEFDGNEVGMTVDIIGIEHYLGKKPIFDLKVYPVQLHAKEDNIVQRMEDRGRRFMASMGHQYYEGLTLPHLNLDIDDDRKEKYIKLFERREDLASEVFVDFEAYYQVFHPFKPGFTSLPAVPQDPFEGLEETSTPNEVLRHSGQEVDLKIAEDYMAQNRDLLRSYYPGQSEANSEHYRLLSHGVPGYSFRHRKWYLLDVDNLRPIDHNSHPGFEYLVIPQEYKDLLLALVDNHTSGIQRRREKVNSQARALDNGKVDIVPGKGQGLIVLLHGPPGSGKTSTAETIAAYTRRPLYSITCGDIGLDPESVETQLRAHTRRADKWGCVLLLDEADVFLVSRTHRELKRNALVSVFLRQLEYYSGILFLTTNRPGTLDEAFKSRIHVSLRYPGMDLESTKLLWNNMMKLLTADNAFADVKVEFDRARLIAFAEKHYKRCQQEGRAWNGRQIRNAFQTALALAHAERVAKIRDDGDTLGETAASSKKKPATVRLAAKHFRTIAKTTEAFEDYIVWLRGKDSDVAREAEVRDDDYDPDLPQARKSYGIRMGGKRSSTFELSAQHHGEQSLSGYAQKRRTRHPKLDSEDDESEEEEQGESDSDGSI